MKKCLIPVGALALASILTACEIQREAPPNPVALAIAGTTVIDPAAERVLENRTVFIDQGRIVAVTPAADPGGHTATRTVDGSGRFLIPGLMDMHVHTAHPHFSETTLALLAANGVTGVREMSGDCWEPAGEIFGCISDYRELQRRLASGEITGPRLLRISSAMVMGPSGRGSPQVPYEAAAFVTPGNAGEGRRLAGFLDERGVDFIKTYNGLPRDAYVGLVERAGELGLEVSGHVPDGVSVTEAATLGQRSIEHARDLPYDCSTWGARYRRSAAAVLHGDEDAQWPDEATRIERSLATFDEGQCRDVLETLAAEGVFYVPTHVTREMDARASETAYREDPRMKYVMDRMKGFWQGDLRNTAGAPPAMVERYREFLDHGLRITGMAHEAGVPVMAGTDANDTLMFPGFRLHDELALLNRAGLTPMETLRAATATPAAYLRRGGELGGVAPGMAADLVLLDADPLADIANTTAIAAVVLNGRLLDRADLDALLKNVADQAAASGKPDVASVEVPRELLAAYEGDFRVPSSGMVIHFMLEEDGFKVTAEGMPVIDLLAKSRNHFFFVEDDTTFEFQPVEAGVSPAVRVNHANGRSEVAERIE